MLFIFSKIGEIQGNELSRVKSFVYFWIGPVFGKRFVRSRFPI